MGVKSCLNIDIGKMNEFIDTVKKDPEKGKFTFKTETIWQDGSVSKTKARKFEINTDEPEPLGGKDSGIDPIELLLASVSSCVSLGFATQAAKHDINLEDFTIETEGDIDVRGYFGIDGARPGFQNIRYTVKVKSDASEEELKKILEIAESTSPMVDNVSNGVKVSSNLMRV
ncbi:MAG: OsmC family protein [Deltaproteobacteria bacterium]